MLAEQGRGRHLESCLGLGRGGGGEVARAALPTGDPDQMQVEDFTSFSLSH